MRKTTSFSFIELAVIVALLALFGLSLAYLNHVYASLTIAFVLAYLLEPVVSKLEKLGLARAFGVPLTLAVFFVALILAGVAIVPKLVAQGRDLVDRIPIAYASIAAQLGPAAEYYLGFDVFHDFGTLMEQVAGNKNLATPITGILQNVFTHTFRFISAILGLLIIPLMAYYLLRDFPKIFRKFLQLVPVRYQKTVDEVRGRLDGVLGGFIRGQLVVSAILSAYYAIAFAVLKLQLALVLGLMAGFFNIVPYLGITTVLVLTLLISFIHGAPPSTFIAIGVVFAVGMAVEGSFLTPRIVGRRVGLSPLMLIIALLVGGELSGLVGMLLAVPIAAILKVIVSVMLDHYRKSDSYNRA